MAGVEINYAPIFIIINLIDCMHRRSFCVRRQGVSVLFCFVCGGDSPSQLLVGNAGFPYFVDGKFPEMTFTFILVTYPLNLLK